MKKISKSRRFMVNTLALCVLGAVTFSLMGLSAEVPIEEDVIKPIEFPSVSIVEVSVDTQRASIETLAEVIPRWNSVVKSFVRGEIVKVSSLLRDGERVKKGDVLIWIDDTAYRAQLERAQSRLNIASVELLKVEREAAQARRNWTRSGMKGAPESLLTLYEPQLNVAVGDVAAAKAELAEAKKQLSYTRITAPFDGVITQREVSPGEAIEVGQSLLSVMSLDELEVPVMLDDYQWSLLARDWQGMNARLTEVGIGSRQWMAVMERDAGHIQRDTRQRMLYLRAKQTEKEKLLPGSFVKIELPGRLIEDVLVLPDSTLTRDGYIWYVDAEHYLRRYNVQPIYRHSKSIAVNPPNTLSESWKIVTTPLASFLPGTKVETQIAKG